MENRIFPGGSAPLICLVGLQLPRLLPFLPGEQRPWPGENVVPCWLQDDWPSGESETVQDAALGTEHTASGVEALHDNHNSGLAPGLVTGSSEGSSLDGEIAAAGFGRALDELEQGSPPEARLVQAEWAYSPTKLGPSDFELLRVVGQGAFGKVRACSSGVSPFLRMLHALVTAGKIAMVEAWLAPCIDSASS